MAASTSSPSTDVFTRLFEYGLPTMLLVIFVVLSWRVVRPLVERLTVAHLDFLANVQKTSERALTAMESLASTCKGIESSQKSTAKVLESMEHRLAKIEAIGEGTQRSVNRIESRVDKVEKA